MTDFHQQNVRYSSRKNLIVYRNSQPGGKLRSLRREYILASACSSSIRARRSATFSSQKSQLCLKHRRRRRYRRRLCPRCSRGVSSPFWFKCLSFHHTLLDCFFFFLWPTFRQEARTRSGLEASGPTVGHISAFLRLPCATVLVYFGRAPAAPPFAHQVSMEHVRASPEMDHRLFENR